ncbi:MAG: DinB family protein [Bacteroidota bacterium]|nr:DinB family protein [Bacteroidota bacterium]
MKKSDIHPMPEFFDRYINLVEEQDLFDALNKSLYVLENLDTGKLHSIGHKVYAPGKWTVHDILQHILDNERIQTYRAMCFARNDKTEFPGYEENDYAANAMASYRNIEDIIEELKTVRTSTIQLFRSFPPSNLQNTGTCFNRKISVLALGFMLPGHQIHHLKVIKEKYEPLINL